MTQWVVIKKDDIEAEVIKEAADDVWVPVMGWEIVGEPTDAPTRDPFPPEENPNPDQLVAEASEESSAEDKPAESAPAPAQQSQSAESAPSS